MLKRDRTGEEKHIDALVRDGMMKLGAAEAAPQRQPSPYPHFLFWDVLGRKGQRCKLIKPRPTATRVLVQFEDGFEAVVSRRSIRRCD